MHDYTELFVFIYKMSLFRYLKMSFPSRCVKRFSGSMLAIRVELKTNLLTATPRRNIHEICISVFLCVLEKFKAKYFFIVTNIRRKMSLQTKMKPIRFSVSRSRLYIHHHQHLPASCFLLFLFFFFHYHPNFPSLSECERKKNSGRWQGWGWSNGDDKTVYPNQMTETVQR